MQAEQQSMGGRKLVCWSDLPKELVEKIGNCLDTHIDVLRFRSVCTTWRSSLPLLENSPPFPLQIPFPLDDSYNYKGSPGYHVIQSTFYIFQPLDCASPCNGWLIKVTRTADGKLRVLNPLTGRVIRVFPNHMPKVLNLLDFRVSQVCKSYHVRYYDPWKPSFPDCDVGYVRKVLNLKSNSFSLVAIGCHDSLCYLKSGDERWTKLNVSCHIEDIIVYKGNLYAVGRFGETIKFDSYFNETKVASRLYNSGSRRKRLVESSGQLFLVDSKFLEADIDRELRDFVTSWCNVFEVKTYRLNEQHHEWVEVHTLGDEIFFAGDDCCFSVSSKDFGDQCRGNCIYYTNGGICRDIVRDYGDRSDCYSHFSRDEYAWLSDYPNDKNYASSKSGGKELIQQYKELHDHNLGVFTIDDGKLGQLLSFPEYADIFWPPSSWPNTVNQPPSIQGGSSKIKP